MHCPAGLKKGGLMLEKLRCPFTVLVILAIACIPIFVLVLIYPNGPSQKKWALPPSIFWDGQLYDWTTEEVDESYLDGMELAGVITSTVEESELPHEHAQANMPILGAECIRYNDDLFVCINHIWWRLHQRENSQ